MSCQIHLRVKTMAFRVLCIGLNSFALNSTSYVLFNEITKPIEFPVLKYRPQWGTIIKYLSKERKVHCIYSPGVILDLVYLKVNNDFSKTVSIGPNYAPIMFP